MRNSAEETRANSYVTFIYKSLHTDLSVWADQQEHQLCADIGCSLEDLPRTIDDMEVPVV